MKVEAPVSVNLSPELEGRVADDPEALVCMSGLAYTTAALLESDKLPRFKNTLSMNLSNFTGRIHQLGPDDFRNQKEVKRFIQLSGLWMIISFHKLEKLGVININSTHTKVSVRREPKTTSNFVLDIGRFGSSTSSEHSYFN